MRAVPGIAVSLVLMGCSVVGSPAPVLSVQEPDRNGTLPQDGPPPREHRARAPQPFPPSTAHVGAAWVPWARIDVDERAFDSATPGADLDDGEGFAIRIGNYDDALGMEGVVQVTSYDDRRADNRLDTYAAYVNLTERTELWTGPVGAWAGIGAGFGLVKFDWERSYISELTALWQVEGIAALQLGPKASLEARAQAFFAAHPSATVGSGFTALVGGTVWF